MPHYRFSAAMFTVICLSLWNPGAEVKYSALRIHEESGSRDTGDCEVTLGAQLKVSSSASPSLWIQAEVFGPDGLPDDGGGASDLGTPPLRATVLNSIRRNWLGRDSIDFRLSVQGDQKLFDGSRHVTAKVYRAWRLPADAEDAEVRRAFSEYAASLDMKVRSHKIKVIDASRAKHEIEFDAQCKPTLHLYSEDSDQFLRFKWPQSWSSESNGEYKRTNLEFELDGSKKEVEFVIVDSNAIDSLRVAIPRLTIETK